MLFGVGRPGSSVGRVGRPHAQRMGVGVSGLDLDFVNGRYALNSPYSSAFPTGWAFSRTGAGTAMTSAGVIVPFATGVPRITDRGLLVEEARTNKCAIRNATPVTAAANITKTGDGAAVLTLETDTAALAAAGLSGVVGQVWRLNNTAGVATAVVAVDGATTNTNAHTCSAYVRGSGDVRVRLNGISNTATPLTSAYVRRATTQTPPDSGNLLSIWLAAGADCYFTLPQLEEGSFATSPIITTGAAATRGADVALIGSLTSFGYPLTLVAEFSREGGTDASSFYRAMSLERITPDNVSSIFQRHTNNAVRAFQRTGGVNQSEVTLATGSIGTVQRAAVRFSGADVAGSYNGQAVVTGSGIAIPTDSPTTLCVGSSNNGTANFLTGYIRRIRILPYAASDAELQALTT